MKEIRALTTLRAAAALLVFLYHYEALPMLALRQAGRTAWDPLLAVWMSGSVGVSIFFVLSGFLITRLYFDRFVGQGVSLREYFVKRIARIWPLFLAFAGIQHVAMAATGERPDPSWLVTTTMTQGFFLDLRYRGLPTAWSLTIEECFYAIAPLVFLAIAAAGIGRGGPGAVLPRRAWGRLLATLAGLVLGLAGAGVLAMLACGRLGWTWYGFLANPEHLLHSTLAGRFPEFAIGVAAAFLHRDGWPVRVMRGARASLVALASFSGIGVLMAAKTSMAASSPAAWLACSLGVALLAGLLILALTREESRVSRLLAHPAGVYLGKVSYGFYLIQTSLLAAPLVAIAGHLGPFRMPADYVLMNLVCAGFYEWLERPARRAIVHRFAHANLGDAAA